MADDVDPGQSSNGADDGQPAGPADRQGDARLLLNTQYIKDLSFENPNAPLVYADLQKGPDVDVNIDVQVRHLQDRLYEVVLTSRVRASLKDKVAFLIELDFAGLATVGHQVPQSEIEQLMLVEVPRFLFPFARSIIGNVTRDGGFPPLLINPIDFEELYRNRQQTGALEGQTQTA
jgi:preprotein translocase subunit SecB